jgi:HNH endonuclease
MIGFEYPTSPHARRHGPEGYRDYGSYRDWLRDEFTFHCVYCLHREQWYSRSGTFHIDHFVPTSVDPERKCEYSNLLYSCATCNEAKKDILDVPDPCKVAFYQCLRITSEGRVVALNDHGEKLRQVLLLDSESNVHYRWRLMRTLTLLQKTDDALYKEYMTFPADLPDLRARRVPQNKRPDGAANCYFVLRERGELPAIY